MKKFRLSVALLVLALVLAIVPAVLAQDTLGASQGDYDLWTAANASVADISTVSYDFTAKLEVVGLGDTNITADLTGTGVIDANEENPAFQFDVKGNVVQGKETTPVNAGLRIVDGMIYISSDGGETWEGQKLSDLMSSAESLGSSSGLPVDPSALASGDLSSLTSNPEAEALMKTLSELKPSDFLSLVRADDSGLAKFTLKVDLAKLLASPAIASMMTSASAGGDADSAAQMQQGMMMAQMMLSTATVAVDEYVDPASSQLQRMSLTIALPLDSMMGPGAAVNLNFDIKLSGFDEAVTVEAPANAKIMDATSSQ